jgi:hypothetical protein
MLGYLVIIGFGVCIKVSGGREQMRKEGKGGKRREGEGREGERREKKNFISSLYPEVQRHR